MMNLNSASSTLSAFSIISNIITITYTKMIILILMQVSLAACNISILHFIIIITQIITNIITNIINLILIR